MRSGEPSRSVPLSARTAALASSSDSKFTKPHLLSLRSRTLVTGPKGSKAAWKRSRVRVRLRFPTQRCLEGCPMFRVSRIAPGRSSKGKKRGKHDDESGVGEENWNGSRKIPEGRAQLVVGEGCERVAVFGDVEMWESGNMRGRG